MTTWIVPGAPLERGMGWRIWYSQLGHADFRPQPVRVLRTQQTEVTSEAWRILPDLPGLDRRMGVLTVTLETPQPGDLYDLHIPGAGPPEPFRWRSLPDKIGPEGVTFLLASCFWHDNDREGTYTAALRVLTKLWSPHFKLLVGDQVYGDWPAEYLSTVGPVEYYAARYQEYWGDPLYREALQTTPNLFMCDDHEFWNDYPERQLHLPRTLTESLRTAHGHAALELYRRFQQCLNPGPDPWYEFAIGADPLKVSFFVADTRSERNPFDTLAQPPRFIQPPQWRALAQWVDGLRGPGVLVLGQPIFQKDGNWRDHSLSNFEKDYGELWNHIEKSLTGQNAQGTPHDILVLSGDIHTGRFAIGRSEGIGDKYGVPELIASPAAMIRPGSKEVEEPNYKFTVRHQGQSRVWTVDQKPTQDVPFMTLANNLGMVRLLPGTNGRVLFELSTWQVRPYDSRSWWDRMVGEAPPAGTVVRLSRNEVELR